MKNSIIGLLGGFLNGLFGSGGGLAVVPLLEHDGVEAKEAHATSVAIIFVLSILTGLMYWHQGLIDFSLAWKYIPSGFVGAIIGATLLKKIPNDLLRRIFGLIILISAVRMLIK